MNRCYHTRTAAFLALATVNDPEAEVFHVTCPFGPVPQFLFVIAKTEVDALAIACRKWNIQARAIDKDGEQLHGGK